MLSSQHRVLRSHNMKPKRLLSLGVLLVGVTAAASLTAAQKPTPAQPTEQQKLKERVDALESQLKETNAKAERATMEKDYIERTQKEAKDYYDKVLNTQTWTLGIVGLIITIVSAATARFGLTIFDRRIQDSLRDASTQLRTEFNQRLDDRFQQLEKAHTTQLKQLEDDLMLRSEYGFQFNQAQASAADERHLDAVLSFHKALALYKRGKPRLFSKSVAVPIVHNLFVSLRNMSPSQFEQNATKELASDVYNGLQDELLDVAREFTELGPLILQRRDATPTAPGSPTTPAKAQESNTPASDKGQATKPQDVKN